MRTSFVTAILATCPLIACNPMLHEPMDRSADRATPLHYGLHVTPDPEQNPIDPPERFEGFHAATDYEVGTEELETDVPVYAICSGRVLYSGFAEGYGGLVVERCTINGPVTVIYGHMDLVDLPPVNSYLVAGDPIGVLAAARSHASDGNRKHLHLGIHKGTELDYRGYVQTEEELATSIDPQEILPAPVNFPPEEIVPYWQEAAEEN